MSDVDHRDFDTTDAEPKPPSCTFTVGGKTWTCRNRDDVPWNLLNSVLSVDDEGTILIEVERFFRGALIPADVDGFVEMLNDPASSLTVEKMQPLIEYVTEHVAARPTKPSSASRRGSGRRKPKSEDGSSSPDTTALASVG